LGTGTRKNCGFERIFAKKIKLGRILGFKTLYKKIENKIMEKNFIEKIRKFIDGDDDPTKEVFVGKKTREIDEFKVKIFTRLGELLDREVYKKETGEIVAPPLAIVFLSDKDDKEWQGAKRKALNEDLEAICIGKIEEIANASQQLIEPIEVLIKSDGVLKKGEIRVEHRWEIDKNKTLPISEEVNQVIKNDKILDIEKEARERTIPFSSISNQSFYVDVLCEGKEQKEWHFSQNQIIIGRNSETKGKVDLHLDDQRIARNHAMLEIDNKGNFWITAKADSPMTIDGKSIPNGKTLPVEINQEIRITDFTLLLRR
jgi:FHA domain